MNDPRIIVALDYASASEAEAFIGRLTPGRCRLKIGLELYTAAGPGFVRDVVARGFGVFLDLKFHDIPNTVERACRQAAALGAELMTVHCLGGPAMLAAAARGAAAGGGQRRPRVLGVTLLTSMSTDDLAAVGLQGPLAERAEALAELAPANGLDGVVCAPTEVRQLRARLGPDFVLVTPGIRPAGAAAGDQQRIATPAEAIAAGSDLLVVGRPITQAPDPMAALAALEQEIERASD
jgi:orotidine-5'-phosphate decarboxylase